SQVFPSITDSAPNVCVVMEAKHPKQNLDFHVRRLSRYLTRLQVVYGVLTNGKDFRIYELVGDQVKLVFQCQGAELTENIEKIKDIIGRDKLSGLKSKELIDGVDFSDSFDPPVNQVVDVTSLDSPQISVTTKPRIMKTIA
ncbi:MAG: hypothetical protein ACKPFK_20745, partial [Dolichospermum sp.]